MFQRIPRSVYYAKGEKTRAVCTKYDLAAESILRPCSLEVNCNFVLFELLY